MKKVLKWAGLTFICIVIILIVAFTTVFWSELRSLASIKQIDDYGMFQMTYFGDYGFDDFLLVGAESDSDVEAFITERLLRGIPINLNITGGGCTVFVARSVAGEVIFGRNFDFGTYSPSMQVITRPDNGYASISTVNLQFIGYDESNLPSGLNWGSFPALGAPYVPFDGMNEKGVAIALLAVPEADPSFYEGRTMLGTTTVIRLVLDKAASVDEAVELLRQYNMYFSGGINCQFLIADASGRSVVVNYWDGDLKITETDEGFQVASNFIPYNGLNIGEGYDEFERYNRVRSVIAENSGILSIAQSGDLLAEVGARYNDENRLQWTVVCNLSTLEGIIFANRNTDNIIGFCLIP